MKEEYELDQITLELTSLLVVYAHPCLRRPFLVVSRVPYAKVTPTLQRSKKQLCRLQSWIGIATAVG